MTGLLRQSRQIPQLESGHGHFNDRDSSTLAALHKLNPYGADHPVIKLDCVNHAEKRMGTSLRKLMKDQTLDGGTNHDLAGIKIQQRLTGNKVVKLQDYYGRPIRNQAGDVGAMTKAIWAALLHFISTDNNPQYGNSPRGQDGWCIFNKAVALLAPILKHSISTISTWMHPKIGEITTPLYERMADEHLLIRMSSGGTHNSNESLNNLMWVYAPKQVFVGHKNIESQLQSAIMRFNAGSTSTSTRMRALSVEPTSLQMALMQSEE